ncbi:MAG: VOC family protein [Streptosporangiales bacterium]|nr:VOC family protein [Streptosporangiales bacterium]
MTAIGSLVAFTIDCPDPEALARFYERALGMETIYSDEHAVYLAGEGLRLGFQKVDEYAPPDWPGQERPQQIHLDLAVTDLAGARERLAALGARDAAHQPGGDAWHVMLDPAGHPFCLTTAY